MSDAPGPIDEGDMFDVKVSEDTLELYHLRLGVSDRTQSKCILEVGARGSQEEFHHTLWVYRDNLVD